MFNIEKSALAHTGNWFFNNIIRTLNFAPNKHVYLVWYKGQILLLLWNTCRHFSSLTSS